MCSFIDRLTGNYKSSAKVVDGNLILSLPDAEKPVVWRMALTHVRASAIEIKDEKDGSFVLLLKTPKEEVQQIAPFTSRAKALNALMAVTLAMQNAHGKIALAGANQNTGSNMDTAMPQYTYPENQGNAGRWIVASIGIVIVGALFFYMASMGPRSISNVIPTNIQAQRSSNSGENTRSLEAQNQRGVPVSADDFLNGL